MLAVISPSIPLPSPYIDISPISYSEPFSSATLYSSTTAAATTTTTTTTTATTCNSTTAFTSDLTNYTLVTNNLTLLLTKILGTGTFGVVYKAVDIAHSNKCYAVKYTYEYDKGCMEASLLAKLSHPNIVSYVDCHHVDGIPGIFMIMEYCSGGTLFDAINSGLDISHGIELVLQVVDAVKYLHEKGISHRDIKPENVLLQPSDDGWHAKLCDFGLATMQSYSTEGMIGSIPYMAPEVLNSVGTALYDVKKTDVWSLGIVLFNAVTRSRPWKSAAWNDDWFWRFVMSPQDALCQHGISTKGSLALMAAFGFLQGGNGRSLLVLQNKIASVKRWHKSQKKRYKPY